MEKIKVGVALGAGAAKGWAHIGVLRALTDLGIEADIVVGTSIGAFVGA
ncbi:MAG: patatin-like phospholipase family protein, partial [Plesiomonas shigelloides]